MASSFHERRLEAEWILIHFPRVLVLLVSRQGALSLMGNLNSKSIAPHFYSRSCIQVNILHRSFSPLSFSGRTNPRLFLNLLTSSQKGKRNKKIKKTRGGSRQSKQQRPSIYFHHPSRKSSCGRRSYLNQSHRSKPRKFKKQEVILKVPPISDS